MAAFAALSACAASVGDLTRFVEKAAKHDLQCPEELEVSQAGALYHAQGCGKAATYACSRKHFTCANLKQLALERGQRELSCPSAQAIQLSHTVFLVHGCEQRASYACGMQSGAGRCRAEGSRPSAHNP